MDDNEIVDLYWQRNERAIKETAAKYGAYCLKISLNILEDMPDSEENVNDTYMKAWSSIPPHRPDSLKAFLAKSPEILRSTDIKRRMLKNAVLQNLRYLLMNWIFALPQKSPLRMRREWHS